MNENEMMEIMIENTQEIAEFCVESGYENITADILKRVYNNHNWSNTAKSVHDLLVKYADLSDNDAWHALDTIESWCLPTPCHYSII